MPDQGSASRRRDSAPLCGRLLAVLVLLGAAPLANALELIGKVVRLGPQDEEIAVEHCQVSLSTGEPATTMAGGRFLLDLPAYTAGVRITLEVNLPNYRIFRPWRGEIHLPAKPAEGFAPEVVLVQMLPLGDPRFLSGNALAAEFERIKREAVDQIRPNGRPEDIDFTGYLKDLGHRLGFSLADVQRAVAAWRARVESDPASDDYQRGLAALSDKRFAEARDLFRRSRQRHSARREQALAEAAQQAALALRDARAEGNAAYLAYDFRGAVNAYRDALDLLSASADPTLRTEVGMALARSQVELGIRTEGETSRQLLAQAVTTYRSALTVYTREQLPQDWAMTQNNLGLALQNQSTRTAGEAGNRLLAQAVTAYRAALTVHTREQLPQQWATTQNNLGNALRNQGTRTAGEAGNRLLAQAVTAYRAALTVYTREQLPQQWATTQNNLGNALQNQGTRTAGEAGNRLLAQAVTAYRAALTVYTREQLPQDWAMTQNNLGAALAEQGTRTAGEAGNRLLAQAVTAYRAALTVRTREYMAPQWEQTQRNLLLAYVALKDARGMSEVIEALLMANPDNAGYYRAAQALYHESLFDFSAAYRVTEDWLQRHPSDLDAQMNFAESHLTTGHLAEARDRLAALIAPADPVRRPQPSTEVALRLLEIAALAGLADPPSRVALPGRLARLRALVAAKPADFQVNWSFAGTAHYIERAPAFAASRASLLALIHAAGDSRDALIGAIDASGSALAAEISAHH
jgi:hypothetical protein